MTTLPTTRDASAIGTILLSSRPYEEYAANFLLTRDDLLGGVTLDCPGGASDFGLTVRENGGHVVSVDPCYAKSPEELGRLVEAERQRVLAWVMSQPRRFQLTDDGSWTRAQPWRRSSDRFLHDFRRDSVEKTRHYVAAALPDLPFADRTFRLVLSGFLFFTYADRLDFEFHRRSIRELLRVCSGEVRLHPLNDSAGRRYPRVAELLDVLAADGVAAQIRRAESIVEEKDCETLVLTQDSEGARP